MMLTRLVSLLVLAGCCAAQAVQAPAYTDTAGRPQGATGVFCLDLAGNYTGCGGAASTTTSGALAPPTAASGKITQTNVSVPSNASTQLVAANANRIGLEIQCDGTGTVGIDQTGGTLTSVAASPLVIPAGSYPLYTPPIATLTAITAYTASAQTCRVTEYLR